MKIYLIAAMTQDRVLGYHNQMPWHMPADLAHFKRLTLGKPVIMGRKTFESLGKPLPGRQNIVISRGFACAFPEVEIVSSIENAFARAQGDEVCVIGGAQIFEQTLAIADTLYLTLIDLKTPGDAFFPAWDPLQWKCIERNKHEADLKNPHAYTFTTWIKS